MSWQPFFFFVTLWRLELELQHHILQSRHAIFPRGLRDAKTQNNDRCTGCIGPTKWEHTTYIECQTHLGKRRNGPSSSRRILKYVIHVKLLKQLLHVLQQYSPFSWWTSFNYCPKTNAMTFAWQTCGTNFSSIEYWNHKHKTDNPTFNFISLDSNMKIGHIINHMPTDGTWNRRIEEPLSFPEPVWDSICEIKLFVLLSHLGPCKKKYVICTRLKVSQ